MICSHLYQADSNRGHRANLTECLNECIQDRSVIEDMDCEGVLWFMDWGKGGTCVSDHDFDRPVFGKEERVAGAKLMAN